MKNLIGKKVINQITKQRGIIISHEKNTITVLCGDDEIKYLFPAAFADILILEDIELQKELELHGEDADFENFKKTFRMAINTEISYLKGTGGKKYRIVDGERLVSQNSTYVYSFDTDVELHFSDGTAIKLYLHDTIVPAYIVSCEEFAIVIQAMKFIGEKIESAEFTAEPWQILEALIDRIEELETKTDSIAYKLACKGQHLANPHCGIALGQDTVLKKTSMQPITFVWGPPGTGKTTTLAKVALEYILQEKRVLMLSYSNVSVDGALLKVAGMADYAPGQIIRYGYPRVKELLESDTLTSYSFVLHKNPELEKEYRALIAEKSKLKKRDARRTEITKQINKIRSKLVEQEKELIKNAAFVATTVSKAIVDKAIYMQKFDAVIFDEASMAYVPQIVFAASLAKDRFCCLGDFRQLPAIVQNPDDTLLTQDIFEYTGITSSVENGYGHPWLVMLNTQYRMHPDIAEFVSKYMYEHKLQSAMTIYEHCQQIADCRPIAHKPMSMIDLSSTYSVCVRTMDGSRVNIMSAFICIHLAEMLVDEYQVGIITPYSAQSRLIIAMLRDLQERNEKYRRVSCATVHQFQGSEKPVIIYDAVDCFRMRFPGTLLTSEKNNTANRLFNVALTRTQGKFILVVNKEYFLKKKISKDLMFTKTLNLMDRLNICIRGEALYDEIGSAEEEIADVFLGDRDEVDSWNRYLYDIRNARKNIFIDIPGMIDDDEDAIQDLENELHILTKNGIKIYIRVDENISIPTELSSYAHISSFVTTPITIIDQEIVWFGEPLSSADFISEGSLIETKTFPCLRFVGKHTTRMLKALLEIPTL